MTLRTARRATVLLCGLIIVFAGLTIAMKQYALVWWVGCVIAAVAAAVIVATNYNGTRRFTRVEGFILSGLVVLIAVVGFITGATGLLPF